MPKTRLADVNMQSLAKVMKAVDDNKKAKEEEPILISCKLPKSLKERIDSGHYVLKMNKTQLIRAAIDEYLKARGL